MMKNFKDDEKFQRFKILCDSILNDRLVIDFKCNDNAVVEQCTKQCSNT